VCMKLLLGFPPSILWWYDDYVQEDLQLVGKTPFQSTSTSIMFHFVLEIACNTRKILLIKGHSELVFSLKIEYF